MVFLNHHRVLERTTLYYNKTVFQEIKTLKKNFIKLIKFRNLFFQEKKIYTGNTQYKIKIQSHLLKLFKFIFDLSVIPLTSMLPKAASILLRAAGPFLLASPSEN